MKLFNKYIWKVFLIVSVIFPYFGNAQTCDYTTSSFTVKVGTAGTLPSNSITKYLLVDSTTQKVAQISNTTTFTGLVQTKTYQVYAFSYVDDNTVTGLTVGGDFSGVTASCKDFSNPLKVRVCPSTTPTTCDFTSSAFALKTATTPPTTGTTQYLLTDLNGIVMQINNSAPSFTGLTGTKAYNVYALSYTGTVNNLSVGSNFSNITGSCLDFSNPFPVSVCVCTPICLPVTTTKIK